jgi:two-component system OmpR family sensor kinase
VSLRTRLLLVLGVVTIAALAVADVAIYSALRGSLFNQVDRNLEQDAARITQGPGQNGFGPNQGLRCPGTPDGFGGSAGFEGAGLGARAPSISSNYVALVAVGNAASTNDCPAFVDGHRYTPRLPTTFSGFSTSSDGTKVTYLTAPAVQKGGPDFVVRVALVPNQMEVIVGVPINDTQNTLHRLLLIELGVSGLAVLAALAAGWWLVRLGLRPLTAVERTAENIAGGDLQHRVPDENDRTEVGRLAKTLNVMLGRIESAFAARVASEDRLRASDQRLRQFVGDASHELRTPIAAVSAYAQLFERGAADNVDDLARVMTGIRSETARMERLVADLLTLTRLDEGQPMEHVEVELVTLCAEAVQTARTVAPEWPLTLSAVQPVEVMGDPHRLRQVLDNLLANVRSHTPPGTPADVQVHSNGSDVVVVVADQGPGLPEEQASKVFERFFRSDPSRSREHGGAGLGLSIVDAIVQAHHGMVTAASAPGAGMTVTVRLPAMTESQREAADVQKEPEEGGQP